jgi:DNA-binding CsgD family transcriptional regulator/PAS domain-containing protein
MRGVQGAESLIGDIYDGIVSSDGWHPVLSSVVRAVGGDSGLIWCESGPARLHHDIALDRIVTNNLGRYWDYFATRNPMDRVFANSADGALRSAGAFAFSRTFRRSEWFNEWARPEGFADVMGAPLVQQPHFGCWLRIRRHDDRGPYGAGELALGRRLAPHVSRAVKVWRKIEAERGQEHLISATLDRLSVGIMVVDRDARLLRSNEAAEIELRSGQSVLSLHGRIRATDPRANDALLAAIRNAAGRDRAPTLSSVMLPGGRLVEVVPLASRTSWGDFGRANGAAALFLSRADAKRRSPTGLFASSFGLTAAEARVLSLVIEGEGMAKVARELGIAITTARSHLQKIFWKTDTTRQTELVKLFFDLSTSTVVSA